MNKVVKLIIKFVLFLIILMIIYGIFMVIWVGIYSPKNILRPPGILTILSFFISWFIVFKKKIIDSLLDKKNVN